VIVGPSSTTAAPATTRANAPPTAKTRTEPARLALPAAGTAMLVGDSGMQSGSPAFVAALQHAGWRVVDTAFAGMGLTRPDGVLENWRATARRYDVDLTIVMIGGWDEPYIESRGANAYRAVVDQAVASFTTAGGKVLWLAAMPGEGGVERELNGFFSPLTSRYPGVVDFLDIERPLRGPRGGYPQIVNGKRLRGPDGWHLCPDGGAAVARAALDHLGLDRPGWEAGLWRQDPDYHDPPGICDP
jgi:hypothetical protein